MLRGTVYHNDQNPQRAVEAFERVLQLDPELREMPASRPLFWKQMTDDLVECGRIEDAGRYLNQALALGPDAELLNRLGHTHFLRGEFDDAERCFRQAAESDPTFYGPRLNLAKLALQRRQRDEALRELGQARLLAPRQYGVLYNLALIYRQLGQAAEAAHPGGDQRTARGGGDGAPHSQPDLAPVRSVSRWSGPAAQPHRPFIQPAVPDLFLTHILRGQPGVDLRGGDAQEPARLDGGIRAVRLEMLDDDACGPA